MKKNHISIGYGFLVFIFSLNLSFAQLEAKDSNHPIYDNPEALLSNSATIPDYHTKAQQLKLTGTIYKSDGVTPAEGVIVYIEQPDENGDFELRSSGDKRYVLHRSWIKTGSDGKYTFYTFIPGNDRHYNQLQQIFPTVKAPSQPEYDLEALLFEDDPLLSKRCKKLLEKNNCNSRILSIIKENDAFVANKDIVLP